MQDSTSDLLDLGKNPVCSGQYNAPLPPDSGMWDQLNGPAEKMAIQANH